jgi:hypothetical protein
MPVNDLQKELDGYLRSWRLHLRWQAAALWALRGALFGVTIGIGCALVARLTPLWDVRQVGLLAAVSTAVGVLLGLFWAALEPRPLLATARWLDLRLGLAERTSTALELSLQQSAARDWVLQDALVAARQVRLRQQIPLRIARWELASVAGAMLLLALAIGLPNPQLPQLLAQRQAQQAQKEQIATVEQIKAEIIANPNLTEAQKAALAQTLDKTIASLQESGNTPAEQATILNNTNVQLQALAQDQQVQQQLQNLKQVGAQLAENATTNPIGQALQAGNLGAAAQQLAQIDPTQLTASQQAAIGSAASSSRSSS